MRPDGRHISVHHIGGRNGSRTFPVLRKFEKDIINVLYDADPDCLEHIRERNRDLPSELHVLPYCLDESCKSTFININYDPFTSSLYDLNPACKSYYYFYGDHDYILSEACRTMEKRKVEAVTMDHIFRSGDTKVSPPDFLSLDTQGSEYEILQGARETLESDIVAVSLETMFYPLYKGQKIFGDVVKLLSEQGFEFARFLNLHEMSLFRAPFSLRGNGFHTFCDVLFLRRIDDIDSSDDKPKGYLMLRKLAFIAFVFDQFEYGIECLRRSRSLGSYYSAGEREEPAYLKFLRGLEQHIEKVPEVYPPTFASKYPSFEASKARFEVSGADGTDTGRKKGLIYRIKQVLKKIPPLFLLLQRVKRVIRQFLHRSVLLLRSIFTGYTDVERFLIRYDFRDHANALRKNRIIQRESVKHNRSL